MHTSQEFYKRQISLSEVGKLGQAKLNKSHVLVVGAGGLGCPVLEYLCAAGVGHLSICDFDTVDYTNLHRQVIYCPEDVGLFKASIAAERLSKQNPHIQITAHLKAFDLDYPLTNIDLIIDCTDNFKAKFICHDRCYQQGIPLVQASIHKFEGQLQVFHFHKKKPEEPCLRCLWPITPDKTCVQTCSEAGVLGVVPGVIGSLQAVEAIKLLLGLPILTHGTTLFINLLNFSSQTISWSKNLECPLCQNTHVNLEDVDYGSTSSLELSWQQVTEDDYVLINIANVEQNFIQSNLSSSLEHIIEDTKFLDKKSKIVVFCQRGITSLKATKLLRSKGYNACYSLKDGLISFRQLDFL